jgi:hypothetical protein
VPGQRSFAAARFLLELDGARCGFVRSVEGGAIKAEVVKEPARTGGFVKKHLGIARVEPLQLQLDLSLDKAVYAWIADAWSGKPGRRSAAVVETDANLKALRRRELGNPLLAAVTFPALDGASKDAAFLTLELHAETVRTQKGSGQAVKPPAAKAKAWVRSNFRLEIGGLECKLVSRIDSFTVRSAPAPDDPVREARDLEVQPGAIDFPNVRITLAESSAKSWFDWQQSFVVEGKNADKQEKSGKIVLLGANLADVLGEIRFFNLGLFRLAEAKLQPTDAVKRVVADLYCERMELAVGP